MGSSGHLARVLLRGARDVREEVRRREAVVDLRAHVLQHHVPVLDQLLREHPDVVVAAAAGALAVAMAAQLPFEARSAAAVLPEIVKVLVLDLEKQLLHT